MRRWLMGLALLLGTVAHAQSGPATNPVSGYCDLGGSKAQVSGLGSTNYQQGDIPGCTISVYLHGTQSLATIFADDANTPLSNPFTAVVQSSPNAGFYIFWAAVNQGYDIVASGGTAPNTYPNPQTIKEVYLGGSGGGSSNCPTGVLYDIQTFLSTGNCGADTGIGQINTSTHTITEWIATMAKEVNVADTTHSGLICQGASNGTTIQAPFCTQPGPSFTAGTGYGYFPPNGAPTGTNQAMVVQSLTPTNVTTTYGTVPFYQLAWGTPTGAVSCENWWPTWACNANYPATTSDITPTIYPQFTSNVFRGPLSPAASLSAYVQDRICPVVAGPPGSTTQTCQFRSPLTPGDTEYVEISYACGLGCVEGTTTISDTLSSSYTNLIAGTGSGDTPITFTWWAHSPGGINTITISVNEPPYGGFIHLVEIRGVQTPDGTASNGSISVSPTFQSVTTTNSTDTIIADQLLWNTTCTFAAGSGYQLLFPQGDMLDTASTNYQWVSEMTNVSPTGTYTPAITNTCTGTPPGEAITQAFTNTVSSGYGNPFWGYFYLSDLVQGGTISSPVGNSGKFLMANPDGQTASWGTPTGSVPTIYLAGTDSGTSGTNYALTSGNLNANSNACPASLTTGVTASIIPAHANSSTTPTFQLCALGSAATIVKGTSAGQVALVANDMLTTVPARLQYDSASTNWILQNPLQGGVGVTSFTGDGTLITNSGSTGGVTATLGTAGGHKWWGNSSGSTTTPGYNSLTTADLPSGTTQTICSGTITINPGSLSSNTCSSAITATCTGLATTDNIMLDFNADPTSTTGYTPGAMVTIVKYPTSSTVNLKVCNNTASTIVPTSVTGNYRAVR